MLDLRNTGALSVREHSPTLLHRFELWMINDGKKYVYLGFWLAIQVIIYTVALINYKYNPLWQNVHNMLGLGFLTARSAALALHVDTALVLFPVCRTVISWIRKTPLNRIIPFDHAILFHQVIGYSIVFFTLVHTGSHYHNYYVVSQQTGTPYWRLMFATGHGITGHIMLVCILLIGVTGYTKIRRKHFNLFWNVHHLFVVYFACFSFHGAFCLLKPNTPPYCKSGATFWKYWVASGVLYLFERLSREWRANRRAKDMKVQKVILHPGKVIEVQFRKPRDFKGQAGQYAFLNCPAVSTQQWHPFTLTSAPEEDYVSVHIRVVGDWTRAFSDALGAKAEHWKALEQSKEQEKAGDGQRKSRMRALSQTPERQQRFMGQAGNDEAASRPSLGYAPIPRRRKNTALSANRPNTMLLVDQSDDMLPMPQMPAMGSGMRRSRAGSGLLSRLSYYVGTGSESRVSQSSDTRGPYHNMDARGGPPVPPIPSLKQLQNYYLREESKQKQQQVTSPHDQGGSTLADENDMKELQAIVNDEVDPQQLVSKGDLIAVTPQSQHTQANVLPQVLIDGPFGSASEDVFNHEISMLFCAGIGCTPFASVLKSIWYRLSYPEGSFRLRKVYFFWVQRDTKSFEWFQDLLKAIEEEEDMRMETDDDMHTYYLSRNGSDEQMIEIHTYLTGRLNEVQTQHLHLNNGELDPITGLRSPTNFGRPNMDAIFKAVAYKHPATDVGVFFCGPVKLGSSIESAAKKWSSEGQEGTKFYYNKENF
ncbi:hypothetical protein FBU59_000703 [Linderina macrospora]|uniref:Uncharacterized protein n=1 Tax=Linderina macrospora TaxID=4868 RepID=A0ACC1JG35_9FUNG|nr:hypothetical protein FBU59_000703 [Linderina macrospora]